VQDTTGLFLSLNRIVSHNAMLLINDRLVLYTLQHLLK